MPVIKEWNSDPYSLAAIWKIDEPESFFTGETGLSIDIKNEKRRMERLAGRFLLKYLQQDFPLHDISPDQHDKPRITDNQYFFSISHSWPYVAAVVSPYAEAGIDIQCWHPRMEQLQHKFLSPEEQAVLKADTELITLAWSAKEAAYKWQGRRGVEFIDHLPITGWYTEACIFNITINLNLLNPQKEISIQGFKNEHFACCVVINNIQSYNLEIT